MFVTCNNVLYFCDLNEQPAIRSEELLLKFKLPFDRQNNWNKIQKVVDFVNKNNLGLFFLENKTCKLQIVAKKQNTLSKFLNDRDVKTCYIHLHWDIHNQSKNVKSILF